MKAIVFKSTGSRYNVKLENGQRADCTLKGTFRLKGIRSTNPIAVGDRVNVEFTGQEAVITSIDERDNYIIRRSINLSHQSHIIAANIDRAIVLVTLALPKTTEGFIDRFLCTAGAYHIPAAIVINKIDIYEAQGMKAAKEWKKLYEKIGYPTLLVSAREKTGLEKLKKLLKNKTTLITGHSGVGKSTLINAIDEGLEQKTGVISKAHLKGKHTTTFAEMLELSFGGYIIDTPGIKELGLVHIEKSEVAGYFPEMFALLPKCRYKNCIHINEPGCAVKEALENGEIAESRYLSYLSILNSEELRIEY